VSSALGAELSLLGNVCTGLGKGTVPEHPSHVTGSETMQARKGRHLDPRVWINRH
jgi:hypothetical protein